MTSTLQPPRPGTPDAGVIEEARARQRRHRAYGAATTILAFAIGAGLFAFTGGGGGSYAAGHSNPAGLPSAKVARASSSACLSSGRNLQGPPSKALLSILAVLRRPATAADSFGRSLAGTGLTRDVFANYIRHTQTFNGSPYYLYPAIVGGCGVEKPREGIVTLETNVDLGHGIIGADGGGGASATDIEHGETAGTGPPGSATSTTLTMLVPDGVASVTLQLPAGRASGYSPAISPPATIIGRPVGNELVVTIPRSNIPEAAPGLRMIWRAPNGHVIRTFNRF